MDPKTLPSDRGLMVFPPELFRLIIQHLSEDRKALCAISLACKMLQHEGQRQLYRKIRSLRRGFVSRIAFFKGILDDNRLALLVHEYSQDTIAHYGRGTLWDYLCRGLQAMANLKVFKFYAPNDQPAADILRDCTFQLRSLVWWNSVDGHLSNFLLSQHSLQKLEVDWPEDERGLVPRSSCPQLRILRGDQGAMETFLPGREVISLHWMADLIDPFVDNSAHRIRSVEHLLPYLSRIRFFSFGYPYTWLPFSSIIGFFPCVEVLELLFPDIYNHEELTLPVLHHFKKLQILVLSSHVIYAPIPIDRRLQIINSIFKSCDTLQQIDFILDPDYQTYRWTAGSLDVQPTLTTWAEVHRWWHF